MERLFLLSGGQPREPAIDAYIGRQDLVSLVRETAPGALELMHDGAPTFCLGDAAFAYVSAHKAHASLGFFNGSELSDPDRSLEGSGKWMRHAKVKPGSEPARDALKSLVAASAADTRAALGL